MKPGMNRLQRDTELIAKLSSKDLFKRDIGGHVFAVVIAINVILWYVNGAQGSLTDWFGSQAALREYLVQETPADRETCRSSICTYPLLTARETQPVFLAAVHYSLPAPIRIRAPAGKFIALDAPWWWTLKGVGMRQENGRYLIGVTLRQDHNGPISNRSDYSPLLMDLPGYVRAAWEVGTGDRVELEQAQGSGGQPLELMDRRFSEIEAQPLETRLRLVLSDPSPVPLEAGEYVRLRFNPDSPPQTDTTAVDSLPAAIVEVSNQTLVVDILDEYAMPINQVYKRLYAALERGQPVLPPQMRIELYPRYGRAEGQTMLLPANTVVHRGKDSFVWCRAGGFALPVWVRELGSQGNDLMVTEQTGARGLPVRPDDWRALSAYERGRVLHQAANLDKPLMNRFLAKDTPMVIAKPDERLRPGLRIRSPDANP